MIVMSLCFYVVKELAVVEQQSFWAKICTLQNPLSITETKEIIALLQNNPQIAVTDYEKANGDRHVVASIWNALRRAEFNDMRARTMAVEFILYVSSETQITRALKKVGIGQNTRKLIVISFDGEKSLNLFIEGLDALGLRFEKIRSIPPCVDKGEKEDLAIEKSTLTNAK